MTQQHFIEKTHNQGTIHTFIVTREAHNFPSPSAFKAVHSCHCFTLLICFRDTPEVISSCTCLFSPTNSLPLQEIVRHELAPFITRSAIKINSLFSHQAHKDAC